MNAPVIAKPVKIAVAIPAVIAMRYLVGRMPIMGQIRLESAVELLDRTFKGLIGRAAGASPLICCVFNQDQWPAYAEPMPRDPLPAIGQPVAGDFGEIVRQATTVNPAVHDGAVMAALGKDFTCRIVGWSYRLFPPSGEFQAPANKGSAFNSCLAMSAIDGVIGIYLVSGDSAWRFDQGQALPL